jgi:hypothetical protein
MQPIDNNTTIEKQEPVLPANPVQDTTPNAETQETQAQINWKRFREQREIERKQKEEIEKKYREKEAEAIALKNAMEAVLNKQPIQQNQQYEQEESEDDRINKKVDAAIAARDRILEQNRLENEKKLLPQRLSSTYKDFNQVCTQENIDYLEYHYPAIAKAFERQTESFEKWEGVYEAVKKLIPNTNSSRDAKKAEQNFNKPQSMTVSGATQTGDNAPKMLDEKRKEDNYARMMRVMKGAK